MESNEYVCCTVEVVSAPPTGKVLVCSIDVKKSVAVEHDVVHSSSVLIAGSDGQSGRDDSIDLDDMVHVAADACWLLWLHTRQHLVKEA